MFRQLRGHPQATRAHKPKITIANFILDQNQISSLFAQFMLSFKRVQFL